MAEEAEVIDLEPSVDAIMSMNIAQRLHAIMGDAGRVQKTMAKNGLKYDFVAHDSVMAAIQPLLVRYRVIALPRITDLTQEGNTVAIRLSVTFQSVDFPQESLTVDSFGHGTDNQDKGPGKAYSYAYKYAFLKTFCLATGDDPENDNINRGPRLEPRPNAVQLSEPGSEIHGPPPPRVETQPMPTQKKFNWVQKSDCITEGQARLLFVKRKQAGIVSPEQWKSFLKEQGWNHENNIPKNVIDAVIAFVETPAEVG